MPIKISVVIPTYHRPVLLKKCLEVLMIQEFPKEGYEIIIVSDGPDQETREVVMQCIHTDCQIPAIKYDYLPYQKGPAAARNKGWKQAQGELIAFTDDDCIPNIYWLEFMWKAYRQTNGMAFTGTVIVPRPWHSTDDEHPISPWEKAEFVTANGCCTKKALQEVNGFDERFSIAWREDSDLEFMLLRHHVSIVYVEDAFIIHPVRPVRWGVSLGEQRKSMFNALLYKKHPSLYRRKKIQIIPPWHYYVMVVSFLCVWVSIILLLSVYLSIGALIIWLGLVSGFIVKRLSGNSHGSKHIFEMIITSILIPFLSVFWRLYGAVKYKVLFL
jgi:glycosyltransferase involved in cell wall biosynthesis